MANPFTSAVATPSQIPIGAQIVAPELTSQQMQVARMQQLAQLLSAQGAQSNTGQTQVVSGWAIPNSPLTNLASVMQTGLGAYFGRKSMEDSAKLQQQMAQKLQDAAFGSSPEQAASQPGGNSAIASGAPASAGVNPGIRDAQRLIAASMISPEYAKVLSDRLTEAPDVKLARQLGVSPEVARQNYLAQQMKAGTQSFQPGQLNVLPTGERVVAPDFSKGMAGGFDAQGNPIVRAIPGAADVTAQMAAAQAAATEGAKPTTITSPSGQSVFTTVGQALGQNKPQVSGVPMALANNPYAKQDILAELSNNLPIGTLSAISQIESNHKPGAFNKNNNGTVDNGRFQINSANPGLNGDDPMAAGKMIAKYMQANGGDLEKAVAAYHGGPNSDPNSAENQRYLAKFKEAMSSGGKPSVPGTPVQTAAQAEASKGLASEGVKYLAGVDSDVQKSGDLMTRYKTVVDSIRQITPNAGAEVRANVAMTMQGLGFSKKLVDAVANGSLGDSQVIEKLAGQEAIQQLQTSISTSGGSQGGLNKQSMKVFFDNNPGIKDDPKALEKLINLQIELHQEKLKEANAAHDWYDQHGGDMTRFRNYWANQRENSGLLQNSTINLTNQGKSTDANKLQELLNKYK